MRIGLFLTGEKPEYRMMAGWAMRSARACMPGVEVIHLTDMKSSRLNGANGVLQLEPAPLSLLRARLFETASALGDWLFIDSDVHIRSSVADVFDHPEFDVALSDRNWPHAPVSAAFAQEMPHNAGVVFSRSPEFWKDVVKMVEHGGTYYADDWYGDQRAIGDTARSGRHRVRILNGAVYNYPPASITDDALGAKIVHCKGNRKEWLRKTNAV